MKTIILVLSASAAFLLSSANALETDQFHAASHILKESSAPLNAYVEDKFERALKDANNKRQNISCPEVAEMVMNEIVGKFSISKISQFAKNSDQIERFPDDSLSTWQYIQSSIYKDAGFPFYHGLLARTINVGGVYIGTDKLGHFALIGRGYYRDYRKNLEKKMTTSEAEKTAVLSGIKQEIHLLGYTLGGVLSFGDMEANYQGMTFAREMCEGENPYLQNVGGDWTRNTSRPFDFKNYVNPKMDESYKPAFWRPGLWKKIAPNIAEVYCDLKNNPLYIERIEMYQSQIKTNRNDNYIKEFFSTRPKFDRKLESIESLCI